MEPGRPASHARRLRRRDPAVHEIDQHCPTAEAYTFRGWAYIFSAASTTRSTSAKRAIEVDPAFGNPYNDIGAYLIAKGELDEAVPWLEQAKRARGISRGIFLT